MERHGDLRWVPLSTEVVATHVLLFPMRRSVCKAEHMWSRTERQECMTALQGNSGKKN